MINGGMPGKPKHLGVPNGRMVSVGSEPEPQGGGGHTQGGVQEVHPAGLQRSRLEKLGTDSCWQWDLELSPQDPSRCPGISPEHSRHGTDSASTCRLDSLLPHLLLGLLKLITE